MNDHRKKQCAGEGRGCLDRRELLVGGLVILGGISLPGCGETHAQLPGAPVQVGQASTFAQGSWTLLASSGLVIGHDAGGLFAYSAACTHEGCLIDPPDASGVANCPCHGSQFDGSGAVLHGPARSPLQHFQVLVQGGVVTVDPTTPVSASTRTPV